jgi:hypothetical protein
MISKDGKQAQVTKSTKSNTKTDTTKLDTGNRKQHADDRTLNPGQECLPQATPAAQKPWRATAHKGGTHNPDSALEQHSIPCGH